MAACQKTLKTTTQTFTRSTLHYGRRWTNVHWMFSDFEKA